MTELNDKLSNEEQPTIANHLLAVVLKTKYKSCANCYLYQLYPQDSCLAGYPLEKLEQDHVIKHRFGVDTFYIPYKPKYGCLGKEQFGKKHHTIQEHIEVAKMLSEALPLTVKY